jgi:ankyrin repeat protein
MAAIKANSPEYLIILLEKGAKPKVFIENGSTPLHYAVQHNLVDCVHILLENGADANRKNRSGYTVDAGPEPETIRLNKINRNLGPGTFKFKW